jgi:hypothetical protein
MLTSYSERDKKQFIKNSPLFHHKYQFSIKKKTHKDNFNITIKDLMMTLKEIASTPKQQHEK